MKLPAQPSRFLIYILCQEVPVFNTFSTIAFSNKMEEFKIPSIPKSNGNIPDFEINCLKIMEALGTEAFRKIQKVIYNGEANVIKLLKFS